jgi:hypothetical protein
VLEKIFQVIIGYNQVEDGVESIKICLKGWQFNIRLWDLECLSLENIYLSVLSRECSIGGKVLSFNYECHLTSRNIFAFFLDR